MENKDRAKQYQRTRNWLELVGIVLTIGLLKAAIIFNLTGVFARWASVSGNQYAELALYFLFFSVYSMVVTSPLGFYSGFILEHQYNLSNQTFPAWFWEWTKKQALSFTIMLVLVAILYAFIWHFETNWWLWAWAAYAVVGLVMGKLFPILIVPLFY